MTSIIELTAGWATAARVDRAIAAAVDPYATAVDEVEFRLHDGCKLWLEAVLRLLASCNQLAGAGKPVPGNGYVQSLTYR